MMGSLFGCSVTATSVIQLPLASTGLHLNLGTAMPQSKMPTGSCRGNVG